MSTGIIMKSHQTIRAVRILLPDTNLIEGKNDEIKSDGNDFYDGQEREQAIIQLQKYFGYNEFKIFNHNIQESLIRINIFILENSNSSNEEIDCSLPITEFASIYQNIIKNIIKKERASNAKIELESNKDFQEEFKEILKEHLNFSNNEIPVSLQYVNTERIQQAIYGINSTLGANLIALINIADIDILNLLNNIKPNIIKIIGEVLGLRGHSNEPVPMKLDEFKNFKIEVYKTFKQLQEIENE